MVIGGQEYEGEVFYGSAIESVRIPSTLKQVEARTFSYCNRLANVEISHGVEHIGEKCFYGSLIREISLPSTLGEVDVRRE